MTRFLHDVAFAPIDKTAFLFAFPVEPPRVSWKFPAIASSFEFPPAAVSAADDVSWLVVVVTVVVVVVVAAAAKRFGIEYVSDSQYRQKRIPLIAFLSPFSTTEASLHFRRLLNELD